MSAIKEAAKGFVAVLFTSAGDETSLIASEGRGSSKREVRRLDDVFVQVPLPGSVEKTYEKYQYVVTDAQGNRHVYKGLEAAGIAKRYHAYERVRGMVRARKDGEFVYSDEEIRDTAWEILDLGGREDAGGVAQRVRKRTEEALFADLAAFAAENPNIRGGKLMDAFRAWKAERGVVAEATEE